MRSISIVDFKILYPIKQMRVSICSKAQLIGFMLKNILVKDNSASPSRTLSKTKWFQRHQINGGQRLFPVEHL